jgi:CDGSH-type Zn-finger protein
MPSAKINSKSTGPCVVKGDIERFDTVGNPFSRSAKGYTLWACGQSVNKPFCDGTHSKVGFSDHASCSVRERVQDLMLQRTRQPRLPPRGRTEVFDVQSID